MKLSRAFKLSALVVLLVSHVEGEELKFGALLCLTGDCAEWGQNSLNGIELALDEINASGGIAGKKITLKVQDTREGGTGANSVTAFKQLTLDSEIRFIIGPTWSVGGLPIARLIAQRSDIVVTSPSVGVAEFNETSNNIFNTWPHDAYSTKALAKYAVDNGLRRVAIFSGNDPWVMTQGNTFEAEFTRLGGQITTKIEVEPKVVDVQAEALRIKSKNPDAVFYSDTYNMSKAAKVLRSLNFKGKQLSILMDETRISEAQGALEGAVFAMYPEASMTFRDAYTKKYGNKPGITADTAYDTVYLYKRAIEAAGSLDAANVASRMLSSDFQGASGRVVFDAKGGVIRTPAFYVVRGGGTDPL